jgi:hypothetical protein
VAQFSTLGGSQTMSDNTHLYFMKKSMVAGLLIIIGIALVFVPALLYWRMVVP